MTKAITELSIKDLIGNWYALYDLIILKVPNERNFELSGIINLNGDQLVYDSAHNEQVLHFEDKKYCSIYQIVNDNCIRIKFNNNITEFNRK